MTTVEDRTGLRLPLRLADGAGLAHPATAAVATRATRDGEGWVLNDPDGR